MAPNSFEKIVTIHYWKMLELFLIVLKLNQ